MKSTKAEIERRVTQIYKLLLSGCNRQELIAHGKKQGWNISESQIDVYTRRANNILEEETARTREAELETTRKRLDDIYYQAYQKQDYKTCLQILKEENEINGLHHPKQIEYTVQTDAAAIRRTIEAAIAGNNKENLKQD